MIHRGVKGFAARLEPVTVRYRLQVLPTALLQGIKWGMVVRNPALGIKTSCAQREMRCWNERDTAVRLAEGRTRESAVFRLALTTGMRLGEILGLRGKDVDLDNATLPVTQGLSWPRGGKPELPPPKRAQSGRVFPIDRGAGDTLKQHRCRQAVERLAAGPDGRNLQPVFCMGQGG